LRFAPLVCFPILRIGTRWGVLLSRGRVFGRLKCHSKLVSLCGQLLLDKILTLDNLRKRGLIVVNWCCMCKRSGESINHLLLHCEVASTLWSVLFTLFGVKWVMNGRVLDLLACWKGQRGNKW
jgi:hypothetical protein